MGTLDNEDLLRSLDTENMLQSIQDLPDQVQAAWPQSRTLTLPTHYIQAHSIVILGLGASAIAGELAVALAELHSRKPLVVTHGSRLPAFVDSSTLVVGVSYTGRTREVVQAFCEAGQRGAKLIGISAGGDIAALCRKYKAPSFPIQYGAHPRAALGYLAIPVLSVLERLGFLEIEHIDHVIEQLIGRLRLTGAQCRPDIPTVQNRAKQLAEYILGHVPVIVGSRLARPATLRWQVQLQQNAKTFAATDEFPTAIHTSLEGQSFPGELRGQIRYVVLTTASDNEDEVELANLFRAQVKKNRFEIEDMLVADADLIVQMLDLCFWGDYVSYYLALLHGVDPSATPNIMEVLRSRNELTTVGLAR